jgi:hypothetical protein
MAMEYSDLKIGDIVIVKNYNAISTSMSSKESKLVGLVGVIVCEFDNDEHYGVDFKMSLNEEKRKEIDGFLLHMLNGRISSKTGRFMHFEVLDIFEENPINKFFDKHPLEK